MEASIIAAIIGTVGSIIAALIGRIPTSRHDKSGIGISVRYRGKKPWLIIMSVLVLWLFISPPLIHWDWGGINFFLIPIVTLLASAFWPIRPSSAASTVLILYPFNFLMEPFGKLTSGVSTAGQLEPSYITFVLAMAFVNALLVAALCRWRGRVVLDAKSEDAFDTGGGAASTAIDKQEMTTNSVATTSLSSELEKLAKLHSSGVLTDDEFRQAKAKLLGKSERS